MYITPIYIIILASIIFFGPVLWPLGKKKYMQHRINAIHQQIAQHFQDTQTYQTSIAARKKHGMQNKNYVYGEVEIRTFLEILMPLKLPRNTIFYDLGSGAGKPVMAAKLAFDFAKCIGIEFFQELVDIANQHKAALDLGDDVMFLQGDFLTSDYSDADCVLVNATCLEADQWKNLILHFEQLKSGCILIVITKRIDHPTFKLLSESTEHMSWGFATTRIYRKTQA